MADKTKLQEYRTQYPEYDDMSDADLASAIHNKFYPDMPEAEFNMRVGFSPTSPQSKSTGFFDRFEERSGYSLKGGEAPLLPEGAGTGARAADATADVLDWIRGAAKTGAEMATFGLSDDAAALGTAVGKSLKPKTMSDLITGENGSFEENYVRANEREQADINRFIENNPIAGRTIQAATLIANPVNSLGGNYVSQGSNWLSRALRAAPVGTGFGGVTGFGFGEGGLNDKLVSGLVGAATGGILSPVVTAASEPVANVAGKIWDSARNIRTAQRDPNLQADRLLARSLTQDAVDPQTIQSAAAQAGPESIMDLAGPNTVALGRQATAAPGTARQMAEDFFEGRVGVGNRLRDTLQAIVPENADDQITQLGVAKARAAKPLYDASYSIDPEKLNTPLINDVLESNIGKQALQYGKKLWDLDRMSGRVTGDPFTPLLDDMGNLTLKTAPDMRILDYMKRGMDVMVDEAYRRSGTEGAATKAARDAFREHLTTVNPDYKAALAAWSGPSHVQDMIRQGENFWKGNTEQVVKAFRALSPEDQQAQRIGAVKVLADRMGKTTDNSNAYARFVGDPDKRTRLAALFPDPDEFNRLFNQLVRERAMFRTQQGVGGGSITFRGDAEKADMADQVGLVRTVADLGQGNFLGPLMNSLTRMGNNARGLSEPVAERLGQMLFTSDPAVRAQVLSRILGSQPGQGLMAQTAQQILAQQARSRGIGGLLGSFTGSGVGTGVGLLE